MHNQIFSRMERKALEAIYKHSGKREVFELYLIHNSEMV